MSDGEPASKKEVTDGLEKASALLVGHGYLQGQLGYDSGQGGYGRVESGYHFTTALSAFGFAQASTETGVQAGLGARLSF